MRRSLPVLFTSFVTVLAAASAAAQSPVLLSPGGSITIPNPTYTWQRGASQDGIDLVVDGPSGRVITSYQKQWWLYYVCPNNLCSLTPARSLTAGSYAWAIVSYFNDGSVVWSPGKSFQVVAPTPPVPIGPSGTVSTAHPTFSWNTTANATAYRVRFFTPTVMWDSAALNPATVCAGNVCSFTPGYTFTVGSYSFSVRAESAVGDSAESGMAFQVAPPTAPVPIGPSGTVTTAHPTFTWNTTANATAYRVRFITPTEMWDSAALNPATVCAGGVCSFTPSHTFTAGSYSFSVRAESAMGDSAESGMAFQVVTLPPPTPIAPSGTTVGRPVFTWSPVPGGLPEDGALQYVLRVMNAAGEVVFALGHTPEVCSAGICTSAPDHLFDGGTYSWGVFTRSEAGDGALSAALTFISPTWDGTTGCTGVQASGDFNGDGRTDVLCMQEGVANVTLALPGPPGTATFEPTQGWLNVGWDQPIVGDYNGDGRADIAQYESAGSLWRVALSEGDHFGPLTLWGVASAQWTDGAVYTCQSNPHKGTGNFDGNGLTDVYCRFGASGKTFVGKSTGSSFDFSIFADYRCGLGIERVGPADLDGDGLDDWTCVNGGGGVFGLLSTGSAFTEMSFTGLGNGYCAPEDLSFVDINGDGRADVYCRANNWLALSTAVSFLDQGGQGDWCHYYNSNPGPDLPPIDYFGNVSPFDLDGDHLAELVCTHAGPSGRDVTFRRWNGTTLGPETFWSQDWCAQSVTGGDFDGDGQADLRCRSGAWLPVAVPGGGADLMTSARNKTGGITRVTYTPSSVFPSVNNPPVRQVVSAIEIDDGRGGAATTSYQYFGGLVDRREGRFLGYGRIRSLLPCLMNEASCPYSDTTYSQQTVTMGMPLTEERRSGDGTAASSRAWTWESSAPGALPRTFKLSRIDRTDYDPGSPSSVKRTATTYAHDIWGHLTSTTALGEVDVEGDEITTNSSYDLPDLARFVFGRSRRSDQISGGVLLGRREADWSPAGDLLQSRTWVLPDNRVLTSSMTYDSWGNQLTAVSPRGGISSTTWDADGLFPLTTTTPANETTSVTWHPLCSAVTSATDPNGATVDTSYDALCRPMRTDEPLGGFSSSYPVALGDPLLQHTRVEAPGVDGVDWVETYFDGLGRTYRTVARGPSPTEPIVAEQTFNARGGVETVSEPGYGSASEEITQITYDGFDRVTSIRAPNGATTSKSYGLWSVTTTDPKGKSTTIRRPTTTSTEAIDTIDGREVVTTTTLGIPERRKTVEDAVGNTWVWTHDSLGRVVMEVDPDSGPSSLTYDEANGIETRTDAKGQTTTARTDVAGRIVSATDGDGETVTLRYGERAGAFANTGRLTSKSTSATPGGAPFTTVEVDYDLRGRATSTRRMIEGQVFTATRTYDSGDRTLSMTYPNGWSVGIEYDEAGRVRTVPGVIASVSYDAMGRPLEQVNANGTATTRTYQPGLGALATIQTRSPLPGPNIQDLAYTYDDESGLVMRVESPYPGESWEYDYDDGYRLVAATNLTNPEASQQFAYDDIGRMTFNSRVGNYVYPSVGQARPHAPVSIAGQAQTYDANGNLTGNGTLAPTWDASNRLKSVANTQFLYDGSDRLKKTSGGTTSLYPMGDNFEITGGVVTAYVTIGGLGVVAKRTGEGESAQMYWLHTDRQGSVQAVTDGTGAVVRREAVRPYGERLSEEGSHTESRGWIQQRTDDESGLSYLHARYYNPTTGLFLSPDPIGIAGGMNEYGYVFGNPVNGQDPSGLAAQIEMTLCAGTNCIKHREASYEEQDHESWVGRGGEAQGSPIVPVLWKIGKGLFNIIFGGKPEFATTPKFYPGNNPVPPPPGANVPPPGYVPPNAPMNGTPGTGTPGGTPGGAPPGTPPGGAPGGPPSPGSTFPGTPGNSPGGAPGWIPAYVPWGGTPGGGAPAGAPPASGAPSGPGGMASPGMVGAGGPPVPGFLAAWAQELNPMNPRGSLSHSGTAIWDSMAGMATGNWSMVAAAGEHNPLGQTEDGPWWAYWGTRGALGTSAVASTAAGGLMIAGVESKLALCHPAHHTFGTLGKLRHAQVNWWRPGVSGSGRAFRIPWLWLR